MVRLNYGSRRGGRRFTRARFPLQFKTLPSPLFDAFIDSPAFQSKFRDLMFLLKDSGMRIPDVLLRAFERAVENPQRRYYFDSSLIYRLYEDTVDPEIRRRCLNLIDELLRRGDYKVQSTLAELGAGAL